MEVSTSFLGQPNLKETIEKFNNSNCDYIHFDVMDGKFVPNKFLTVKELTDLITITRKKIDVHLMVNDPSKYIEKLSLYDVYYITIHYEIKDFEKYIDMIKKRGIKVGLSVKLETNIENIIPYLKKLDLVLIMSSTPGASGGKFDIKVKDKINKLKEEIQKRKLNTKISVDGGINDEILDCVKNADILVSSSYILKDLRNINVLKNI